MNIESIFYCVFFGLLLYAGYIILRIVYGFASEFGKCDNCNRLVTPSCKKVVICQHCIDANSEGQEVR